MDQSIIAEGVLAALMKFDGIDMKTRIDIAVESVTQVKAKMSEHQVVFYQP